MNQRPEHQLDERKPRLLRIMTSAMGFYILLNDQPRFMQEQGLDITIISNNSRELDAVLAREKVPHIMVPMVRDISLISDLKSLIRLIRIMKKMKPDIVHANTAKASLLSMIAAWWCRVPVRLSTVSGIRYMNTKGLKRALLKFTESLTYRCATRVNPQSFGLRQYIIDNKLCRKSKLLMIGNGSGNGVDMKRFSPESLEPERLAAVKAQIKQYDPACFYLLFVGRMVRSKGMEEFMEVYSGLKGKYPRLRLIAVGPFEEDLDPLSPQYNEMLNNDPTITHINWSDDVEYFMQIGQLFIFPSHREGFPNVLMQAGSMQCPIVASAIEGTTDIIKEGETGLLFEKENREEMCRQLERAINNYDTMKTMAARLYDLLKVKFDRPAVQRAICQTYSRLMEEKGLHFTWNLKQMESYERERV